MKNFRKRFLVAFIILASAAVFFATAFSTFDNYLKALLLLANLFLTGTALHQLTGVESYYGVLLVRGVAGFGLMKKIARRFARETRFLADLGLGIGFGLLYLRYVSGGGGRKHLKKFLVKAFLVAAFFAFLFSTTMSFDAVVFGVCLLAGLFGMGLFFLAQHALAVFTVAGTPPGVTLLIPGVTVPIEAVVAIVIIAVVHELAHGVLCKVEHLELKSSGLLSFAWLPVGAFVEPNEEKFKKISLQKKRRILVAGSTSNVLFFIVFLALAFLASLALNASIQAVSVSSVIVNSSAALQLHENELIKEADGARVASSNDLNALLSREALASKTSVDLITSESCGVKKVFFTNVVVVGVKKGFPAEQSLHEKELILAVDGARIYSLNELRAAMNGRKEGSEVVLLTSEGTKKIVLGAGGKMGAEFSQEIGFETRDVPYAGWEWLYALLALLVVIIAYTYLLNFVLGTVNLMPLFITDGHRIVFEEASARFGENKGGWIAVAVGLAALALLAVNALPWFLH